MNLATVFSRLRKFLEVFDMKLFQIIFYLCSLCHLKKLTSNKLLTSVQDLNIFLPVFQVQNLCGSGLHSLKGLSYEIDFENVDENWQILALIRAAAGF